MKRFSHRKVVSERRAWGQPMRKGRSAREGYESLSLRGEVQLRRRVNLTLNTGNGSQSKEKVRRPELRKVS